MLCVTAQHTGPSGFALTRGKWLPVIPQACPRWAQRERVAVRKDMRPRGVCGLFPRPRPFQAVGGAVATLLSLCRSAGTDGPAARPMPEPRTRERIQLPRGSCGDRPALHTRPGVGGQ